VNTALIPTVPSAAAPPVCASGRPQAEFLAQLIAARGRAPQTRARRRAEPEEAIAAYAANDHQPLPTGRALSRSL
jgi:hypothetical protein